ncbi:MAG: hypothetical protein N2319_04605 [Candidatus Kapabacteria bacterium]|nr:hypothetical protein [Candidatus Kapabacteria bacterium]
MAEIKIEVAFRPDKYMKQEKKVLTVYSNDSNRDKLKKLAEAQLKLITGGKAIVDSILKVF